MGSITTYLMMLSRKINFQTFLIVGVVDQLTGKHYEI